MVDERAGEWARPRRGTTALVVGAVVLGGAGLGLALASRAGASSSGVPASCASSDPHLTVQGSGQGAGTPDVLTAAFGFSSTASSSAAALTQNNAQVAQALQALAASGVAKRDTRTTGLNLSAQYAYPHGVPVLTGYQATETLTATLRHLATDGTTIDAVVRATGNAAQVNSLSFTFADPSVVQDRARSAAVHQAVAHAAAMAAAAGRRLGPVCSLTDNTEPEGLQASDRVAAGGQSATAGVPVPLEPGTQIESDQVTMVYALSQSARGTGTR